MGGIDRECRVDHQIDLVGESRVGQRDDGARRHGRAVVGAGRDGAAEASLGGDRGE